MADDDTRAAAVLAQREAPAFPGWSAGAAFLEALSTRDFDRLHSCLSPTVRLRALFPPGPRECDGAQEAVDLLRMLFEGAEDYEVLDALAGQVGPRLHLAWRLRLRPTPVGNGWHTIEQQAYADAGEQIESLDVLCSGFIPEPSPVTR
jgi:hypothetical protein